MNYTFIGYGVSSGKFKSHEGKDIEYNTKVVVVQCSDDRGYQYVKTFKLHKDFHAAQIRGGQNIRFAFDEYGKITTISNC